MNGARPFSHEVGTWTQGYEAGVRRARRDARVEAFVAIRRAATFARQMDARADSVSFIDSFQYVDMAKGARAAIRAAIGSAKA